MGNTLDIPWDCTQGICGALMLTLQGEGREGFCEVCSVRLEGGRAPICMFFFRALGVSAGEEARGGVLQ